MGYNFFKFISFGNFFGLKGFLSGIFGLFTAW